MKISSRAPFYDLFKLIVAVILLLIFLWIWIRQPQSRQPELPLAATFTPPPATQSPAIVPTSSTSVPLTEILLTPTTTATPVTTETQSPTLVPTAAASPTESPVPEPSPTPIVEIPEGPEVCQAIARSQLQVGMQATILHRLNFRSSPGISDNWILTNVPGTQVEIIGGPECKRYQHGGAYLWWQIKLPKGMTGWSAEASAFGAFYFMEPIK